MLQLPNDVMLSILELLYYVDKDFNIYGEKDDLLASRATCRRIADIGRGLAFEHIIFIQDEEGYKRLLDMSRCPHVCEKVRRLTCVFEDFEADPTPDQFAASRGFNEGRWKTMTQEEFDEVYEKYCRGYQYQQLLEDGNLDIESLVAALPRFCRLRSLRIFEDLRGLLEDWGCHDRCFTYSKAGQRLFLALASALSISGLGIEELVLGSFRGGAPSLLGIVQGLSPARLGLYQEAFGNLKRLEALLPMVVHHEDGGFAQTHELNWAGISALIQSAPLLEELRLGFDMSSHNALSSGFLRPLQISRLRILRLSTVLFQEPFCLVKFLSKHGATLKRVEFEELCLQTGSWETVFIGMRDVLTLDSIDMKGRFMRGGSISGGFMLGGVMIADFEDREYEIDPYWVSQGHKVFNDRAIENFIQRKTNDNPFDLLRAGSTERTQGGGDRTE